MSSASVRPGDVLAGKYRVERVLGSGGMGYVVAARHLQLDQLVAMKFLRKGAVENAEAGARFLREAKAVVKLKNEHIAKVFDVGTLESGEPYIVMEHLDGCDLSALSKQRGAISPSEACEYIIQACEALAEAHGLGIIHRDIKLANLFVTRGPGGGPLVKVLDFGISKVNPFGESEHEMTRTSSMLGSPRFMSPEQMRDPRAVDARSDIWSLGVVLYRLVAGRPPFEADTLGRLLTMVMHEQHPPLGSVVADLPPGFDVVVGKCLEKDPATRFANVAELAYALVPYCVDPIRARGVADRIAAMLSVPPIPSTVEIPTPLASGRVSTPPGQSDTGTAAPWAGTHGGTGANGRSAPIWAGVALAAVLVLASGVFVKVRNDRARAEAATRAAAAAAVVPTVATTTVAPMVRPAAPAVDLPPAATLIGASPTPAAPPTGTATIADAPSKADDHRATRLQAAPRRAAPPAPRKPAPKPAAPAPKGDDGIPATRD